MRTAETSALQLFELWQQRPGGTPILVDGPFAGGRLDESAARDFPPQNADDLLERAATRRKGGHPRDAEEAARYALIVDPSCADAAMLLGVIAFGRDDLEQALEWFEHAMKLRPEFPEAQQNADRMRELLTEREESGDVDSA